VVDEQRRHAVASEHKRWQERIEGPHASRTRSGGAVVDPGCELCVPGRGERPDDRVGRDRERAVTGHPDELARVPRGERVEADRGHRERGVRERRTGRTPLDRRDEIALRGVPRARRPRTAEHTVPARAVVAARLPRVAELDEATG
jgi:hypothetical protein